ARRTARGPAAQLGFLILLKLFQRLGRPVPLADAPRSVVEHVARGVGTPAASLRVEGYGRSGTRRRHLVVADYGATAGLPVDGPAFVGQVRDWLDGIAQ